jgi:hypothetical protein
MTFTRFADSRYINAFTRSEPMTTFTNNTNSRINIRFACSAVLVACTMLAVTSGAGADIIMPTGVTATANAWANNDAIYAIDGSGLSEVPTDANVATVTHAAGTPLYTMWGAHTPIPQAITFDLGAEYQLDAAWLWNYNQSDTQGARSMGDFDIYVGGSGDSFASTLAKAGQSIADYPTGSSPGLPEKVEFAASGVQYVRFEITGHSLVAPADTIGLSEVRFSGVIPEPSTLILAMLGLLGLMGFRRRRNR